MRIPRCLVVLTVTLSSLAVASSAAAADACSEATRPCVALASVPDSVSVRTDVSTTYIRYEAVVVNRGGSTMSQIVVRHAVSGASEVDSLTTTQGTCNLGTATCAVGSLAADARATVAITVIGPRAAGTVADTVFTTFSAGGNPGSDPKENITASASTTVTANVGNAVSYVPPGVLTTISTDPTGDNIATRGQSQIAEMEVKAPAVGVLASLKRAQAAFSCPKGSVCRKGDWIEAHADIGGTAAAFFDPPLRFTLHWDGTLVSKQQNVLNFSVFYKEKLSDTVPQIISRRCTTPISELPCLESVTQEAGGDFSAVLVRNKNGYMR
jgi:hypothetical protein